MRTQWTDKGSSQQAARPRACLSAAAGATQWFATATRLPRASLMKWLARGRQPATSHATGAGRDPANFDKFEKNCSDCVRAGTKLCRARYVLALLRCTGAFYDSGEHCTGATLLGH